jgi:hypothetical protein
LPHFSRTEIVLIQKASPKCFGGPDLTIAGIAIMKFDSNSQSISVYSSHHNYLPDENYELLLLVLSHRTLSFHVRHLITCQKASLMVLKNSSSTPLPSGENASAPERGTLFA